MCLIFDNWQDERLLALQFVAEICESVNGMQIAYGHKFWKFLYRKVHLYKS
jgi:hypothetical protein